MLFYLTAALLVCMTSYTSAQYYNNQPQRGYPPPQQRQPQQPQQPQGQQNTEAWRRWYYQQRQQQQQPQQPAYSPTRARQPAPLPTPTATSQTNYYNQRQPGGYAAPSSSQYSQQYYQQRAQAPAGYNQPRAQAPAAYSQQRPQAPAGYSQQRPQAPAGYNQQQGYAQPQPYTNYQQPNNRPPAPAPATPAPPTTPAAPPVEVEFEMEVPTTTTAKPATASSYQWGHYSQNAGSSQYSSQYQPGQSGSYQQGQYQQPAPLPQSSGYSSSYYQPAPSQQQPAQPQQQPAQPTQPQPTQPQPTQQQQQQYAQSGWSQPQQQSSYGAQSLQPAADPTDPFSTKFDMNALKPTVFNSQYQNQPPQQGPSPQTGGGEYAGLFGDQISQRQNPNAPPGKADFASRGPNPIQLNQFMAQPTAPKDSNALDALLGSLLSGTVAAQNSQQASFRPMPNTTTKPPPPAPASSMVSERLNGFILGPKSEYRSNMFSEIPVNNAGYDSFNPLAGFMGETPPPPVTTTPVPPGRNGDFLEGFIGVNKAFEPPKTARDNYQPNIYVYNPMNDAAPPVRTPPPPRPAPMATNDQVLNNMGTQELTSMVEKLLGVLGHKQGAVGQG